MENKFVEIRNEKLAATVIKALESRNFEAYYCADREMACEKALELIPSGSSVSWGGSVTLDELGIKGKLAEAGYELLDRDGEPTPEAKMEMMRRALTCDVFITGTNGLSEDGQLVNVDGNGNRVAAMTFGPKSVIVFAGMNKIAKTAADTVVRARNTAAPANTQRFSGIETPCSKTGACGDCKSQDCICSYIVTTRMSRPAKRIKVILVGESLGF